MSDVRANAGVPVLAQFTGIQTPTQCAPVVVDSTTGIIYSWKTGDVITPSALFPVVLTTDVSGVLPTANGGTSVDIASAALPLGSGQITFPAVQNPSAGVNTLDDYEEGTWTPTLTFATVGDLAVAYTRQLGTYTKVGRLVTLSYAVVTSSFTFTTSASNLQLTGVPFTALTLTGFQWTGAVNWSGITKATYTQVTANIATADNKLQFVADGSGVAASNVVAADMPTGGSVILRGQLSFETA